MVEDHTRDQDRDRRVNQRPRLSSRLPDGDDGSPGEATEVTQHVKDHIQEDRLHDQFMMLFFVLTVVIQVEGEEAVDEQAADRGDHYPATFDRLRFPPALYRFYDHPESDAPQRQPVKGGAECLEFIEPIVVPVGSSLVGSNHDDDVGGDERCVGVHVQRDTTERETVRDGGDEKFKAGEDEHRQCGDLHQLQLTPRVDLEIDLFDPRLDLHVTLFLFDSYYSVCDLIRTI